MFDGQKTNVNNFVGPLCKQTIKCVCTVGTVTSNVAFIEF